MMNLTRLPSKPFLRRALLGASVVALTIGSFGASWAQDSFDLGVPADSAPAAVAVPVEVTTQQPAPSASPVPQPAAVDAAAATSAPVATPVSVEPVVVPGAAAPVPAPAVVAAPVVQPVAEPAPSELASPAEVVSPAPVAPATVVDAPAAVPAKSDKVQGITKSEAAFEEDLFYDANDIIPEGELAKKSARKVNPKLEPGSKLIVVNRDSGPGSRPAQIVSANRALKLGRYEAALEIYQTLYEKNRKDPQVLMGVAVALQRMGNFEAAIAAYQELLEVQPKNVGAEVNMLGLMSEKYPAVALRRLEELRREKPSEMAVVAQLAVTQAQMNNMPEALKYLAVAASMQPQNPNHVYNMAIIADRAGNRKEAVQYYEQALEMDSVYDGGRSLPRDVIFERLARLR